MLRNWIQFPYQNTFSTLPVIQSNWFSSSSLNNLKEFSFPLGTLRHLISSQIWMLMVIFVFGDTNILDHITLSHYILYIKTILIYHLSPKSSLYCTEKSYKNILTLIYWHKYNDSITRLLYLLYQGSKHTDAFIIYDSFIFNIHYVLYSAQQEKSSF